MNDLYHDVNNPRLRDLAGDAIVSEPASCHHAAQVVVRAPFLDDEMERREAWREAYDAFPLHTYLPPAREAEEFTIKSCCLPEEGFCHVAREAFVDTYLRVREAAQAIILQDETGVLTLDEEDQLDLRVDPIAAMAADHIRFGSPNRIRSHR